MGVQTPRILQVPDYVTSAGTEAIELAARAGLHLDPWEQLVLMGALGERADGRWAALEVGIDVPRQNGKGSIEEVRELAGPILFGERLLIHSAHEQATSSEHFLRLLELFEEAEFTSRMKRPIRGKGSEAILFTNGARILFKTRTGGGGRGLTGDFVCLDEAMILPTAAMAALGPTLAARSMHGNPQIWYAGSAVDQEKHEHGEVFTRVRQRGMAGKPRVAWFEWSVEGDDPDLVPEEVREDPISWAQANPGMGIRISAEHISNECGGLLGAREFAVERLGVGDWPALDGEDPGGLSLQQWLTCTDRDSELDGSICFAFDVRPDRSKAAIVAAGRREDGRPHIEVVDHRPGTGWVVERLGELIEKWSPITVICDGNGPAAALLPRLAEAGIEVEVVTSVEHARACGILVDMANQDGVRHLGQPEMTAAIRGAARRGNETWTWSRKNSAVDISPLVAGTLALWGAETYIELAGPTIEVFG